MKKYYMLLLAMIVLISACSLGSRIAYGRAGDLLRPGQLGGEKKEPSKPTPEPEQKEPNNPNHGPDQKGPGNPNHGPDQKGPGNPNHGSDQKGPGNPNHGPDQKGPANPNHGPDQKGPGNPNHGPDQKGPGNPNHGPDQKGPDNPNHGPDRHHQDYHRRDGREPRHDNPNFYNERRLRDNARSIIHRTAMVLREAQQATARRHYSYGLAKAISHQEYARDLYSEGYYRNAIYHSIRARNLAFQIIRNNRQKYHPDYDWDKTEKDYLYYAPYDNDIDLQINWKIHTDKEAIFLKIIID